MLIECPANVRLQNYLLSQDIHLATSCGGRGNCAKCAVKIIKGTVTIQTMDRIWFTREQLEEGYRLGCQVFTKEPTIVEIPDN
ncbi:MAG: 2Fe-2S iron-sulfur cluster binding domain-containing protein [Clostridiales bacterium]|jgi:Na+-transporting NADH:ubiquinone oxidoreductase subunit F|nr:2Fe-2S iron-sulfur cluster binding domain-containing protein [Clostridiales bacterium]